MLKNTKKINKVVVWRVLESMEGFQKDETIGPRFLSANKLLITF